jgi:hypothetical protein
VVDGVGPLDLSHLDSPGVMRRERAMLCPNIPIWSDAEDIRQETSTLPQPSNDRNGFSLRPCPQKTAQHASGDVDVRVRTRCGSRSHLNHRKPYLHHRDPSPCKGKEAFTKVPKGSCARSDNFQRQVCGSARGSISWCRCSGGFDGQLERSEPLSLYKIASPKQFTLRTRSAPVFGAAGNDRRCLPVPGNGHASGRYSSLAERPRIYQTIPALSSHVITRRVYVNTYGIARCD